MTQLNEQVRAQLREPIPQSELKTREGRAGKTFTYANVDYLESRLTSVDNDWQNDNQIEIAANDAGFAVTLRAVLKILGVQRVANAGYFIPVLVRYYDRESRQWKERPLTGEEFHTNIGRIEASGFRRACARFELGAELWPDEPLTHEESTTTSGTTAPSVNGHKGPTERQANILKTLQVRQDVIDQLDFGYFEAPWFPSGNKKSSYGSEVINLMLKTKDRNQNNYKAKEAYQDAVKTLAEARSGTAVATGDDDADTW